MQPQQQLYHSNSRGSLSRRPDYQQQQQQQHQQQQPQQLYYAAAAAGALPAVVTRDSARSSLTSSTAGSTAPLNPRRLPTPPMTEPNPALEAAIEQVVASYARHTRADGRINVVEALQEFWRDRYPAESGLCGVTYESKPGFEPPFVCFVQLPGGACFATCANNCATKAEARRSAAKVALMNSVFNDHPARRITPDFVDKAVADAAAPSLSAQAGSGGDLSAAAAAAGGAGGGVEAFRLMLESNMGRTMLEFQEMMTVFQLLHWNGSLRAMRQRNCTRSEVIAYYRERQLDDDMRSQMALDWIGREQEAPGLLNRELALAEEQLLDARLQARELRFFKEKCDIVQLALSQIGSEA